jgi:hypothetical protein
MHGGEKYANQLNAHHTMGRKVPIGDMTIVY